MNYLKLFENFDLDPTDINTDYVEFDGIKVNIIPYRAQPNKYVMVIPYNEEDSMIQYADGASERMELKLRFKRDIREELIKSFEERNIKWSKLGSSSDYDDFLGIQIDLSQIIKAYFKTFYE